MVKRIKKVTKNKPTRKRKKLIVVGTEGVNRTETLYLHELEKKQEDYHFLFAQGNGTDPVKIVRNTAKRAKFEELSYKQGDMAISIFDLDLDRAKESQMEEAKKIAKQKNVQLITSNPCFEVWYLEHFGYTSKPFSNSAEVIRDLQKKMPGYQKSQCEIDVLYPKTEEAIQNSKKLVDHHVKNGDSSEFANPRTDVYVVAKILLPKGDIDD
ncbi:MAG: RloB domain-containing protein [Firmicutes bacterium]|nr:RloB domain-containing protein [Bacillota bacterium]